jgi:hypothetical protein
MTNNEGLTPNVAQCGGCKYFLRKGSRVADRFPVQVDTCVLLNTGRACICLTSVLNQESVDDQGNDKPIASTR